jgi:hypothetical protein
MAKAFKNAIKISLKKTVLLNEVAPPMRQVISLIRKKALRDLKSVVLSNIASFFLDTFHSRKKRI